MLDWLWTYWSPWSVFLYISGAVWVIRALADEPIYVKDRRCKVCELVVIVLWPAAIPIGLLMVVVDWLRDKLGCNRTLV